MTKYKIKREKFSNEWKYTGYKKWLFFFWEYIPGTLSYTEEQCVEAIRSIEQPEPIIEKIVEIKKEKYGSKNRL